MRVASAFQRAEVFWATTFSFEPELFDEFIFRRLGEPPLNAVVICDARRHQAMFAAIDPADAQRLRRPNRDYVLRGFEAPGRFHPKTYFVGSRRRGTLYVGSGNLTTPGIERGREVFCRFATETEDGALDAAGLASIRSWRSWIERLVDMADDPVLRERWLEVRARCTYLDGDPPAESEFVHNLDEPLMDQVARRLRGGVLELHALAPFFDRSANALAQVLDRFVPRRLVLYLGGEESVDGEALRRVCEASGTQVVVRRLASPAFIHAKLIGFAGQQDAVLLSGSANLSQAALLSAVGSGPYANVEAGVIGRIDPSTLRGVFERGGAWSDATLADAALLTFRPEAPVTPLPVRLLAARLERDGTVSVQLRSLETLSANVWLTAGGAPERLVDGRTTGPLALPTGGALVWCVDEEGGDVSNRVPLDDPESLRRWLGERESAAGETPEGIDGALATHPAGQLLAWLHQRCVFDLDDTPAGERRRSFDAGASSNGADEVTWQFLEKLEREELTRDARIERYRSVLNEARVGNEQDEILVLLRLMLAQTPAALRELRSLVTSGDGEGEEVNADAEREIKRWTLERRLQVRIGNVLERWARAVADPRFAWLGPEVRARNFAYIAIALCVVRFTGSLSEERISRITGTLLETFLGGERTLGVLRSLDDQDREAALAALPAQGRHAITALVWLGIRPTARWRDVVFAWQPALAAGIEHELLSADDGSTGMIRALTGEEINSDNLADRLLSMATYDDDAHWSLRLAHELGFEHLEITRERFSPRFGCVIEVRPLQVDDPRLVTLVRRALAYRRADAVILTGSEGRIALALGETFAVDVNGVSGGAAEPVTAGTLDDLERSGLSLAALLDASARSAATT